MFEFLSSLSERSIASRVPSAYDNNASLLASSILLTTPSFFAWKQKSSEIKNAIVLFIPDPKSCLLGCIIGTECPVWATCIACLGESAPHDVKLARSSVGDSIFVAERFISRVSGTYPLTLLIIGSYASERVIPAWPLYGVALALIIPFIESSYVLISRLYAWFKLTPLKPLALAWATCSSSVTGFRVLLSLTFVCSMIFVIKSLFPILRLIGRPFWRCLW